MSCESDLTALDLSLLPPSSSVSRASTASAVSLFPLVLFSSSHGLNLRLPELQRGIRPLDERDLIRSNEEVDAMREAVEADAGAGSTGGGCLETQEGEDDEMIVHVRFSELVRIKSLLVGTGGGLAPTSPRQIRLWVNRPSGLSFDEAESTTPEQEFALLESAGGNRGSTEYPLRLSKFSNVRDLTIRFSHTRSGTSRVYYLGFMGESRTLKKEPGEKLKVGADTSVSKMVEGVRETKGSGLASVR